jgi:Family of unknown function (DUF6152)
MSGTPRFRILTWLAAGLLAGAAVASAHHSFAMFDTNSKRTLEGVVTSFEWSNPHAYIEMDVLDDQHQAVHWSIELGSPSILMQSGWKFSDLKPGDQITAEVSPLRNGSNGGFLEYVSLADGRILGNGPGRGGPAGGRGGARGGRGGGQ